MELRDYIQIIRRSWIVIVAVTLLGVVAAGVVSLVTTPIYSASTSVFFAIQTGGSTAGDLNSGVTYVQNQVKSFSQLATTDRVLQPVINDLKLPETTGQLASRVSATAPLDTVIIQISVDDPSAAQAATLANAIGQRLTEVVGELTQNGQTTSPVKASIVQTAKEPTSATSPNIRLNLALGLLVGLALGVGIAVLRRVLDVRVHGSRDVAEITDASILGGIIFDNEASERPLVVQVSPLSPRAEAFRQLRTNLQFVEVDEKATGRTFVVTSSVPSEGKSTTAVNLAITLAEAGSKVLLIDGDLRRPKVAEYMGIEGAVGLTDHLIGQAELEDVLQPWGAGNLEILPAGQVPPNPSELLGSKAMIALMKKLDKAYDIVIIDAPPLLPVTDAAILAKLVSGGAIMVVGSGKITKHQLEAALTSLQNVDGRLAGLIMNLLPVKSGAYGYYGYYGYYAYAGYTQNGGRSKKPGLLARLGRR
ncbi:polysaccharide biosynthesis tyrosine autokinase [Galbitalea sp. SE-J8]|uniref:polysaccharide biosynthesis tyrosine autokinase n=1 Tax=Galbitalea sp. SE-J8 TaxID=3054952 RepID=UPI00259C97A3|nr:polysaccharide biosynthesis tyrosine autokinase [Galbitalea sp. SE-J8]MDM4763931.1 polysaccharide biosynthesis tyrosine autokinase [Galbitalea sp. SE-J8]